MRVSTHYISPGRAKILVLLGATVIITLLCQFVDASVSVSPEGKKNNHDQNKKEHQQQVQVEEDDLVKVDFNSGYHKNGGVDFRIDSTVPRIDYLQEHRNTHEDATRPSLTTEFGVSNAEAEGDSCLVFSDEFDRLDRSIWKPSSTFPNTNQTNYEFQAYDLNTTNIFTRDGIFYIRPTLTENRIGIRAVRENGVLDFWGSDPGTRCTGNYDYGCFRVAGAGGNILNPIQSGLVRTAESFKFKYGKVVIRAKMPKGKWIWPYGSWPASGEIDLVESRGNGPEYGEGGYDKMSSTLHWGPSFEFNRYKMTHAQYSLPGGATFADEFHEFTLDWTPQGIKTYVGNDLLLDVPFDNMFEKGRFPPWVDNLWEGSNAAPFDQEFYLIINVAVGGTAGYFPDGVGNKPWSDRSEHAVNEFYAAKDDWYPTWGPEHGLDRALAVDYIRVYKYGCHQ
ncbi:hypothetical protein BG004_004145 [Podila humilis]|nr:hypothetical protein BG004_004145 [Podila humilis]